MHIQIKSPSLVELIAAKHFPSIIEFEMDDELRGVLSILNGGDEQFDLYSSVTDFKQNLGEEALIHEELVGGWVLYEKMLSQFKRIISLFRSIASSSNGLLDLPCLMQFWRVVKVEGSHHYLSCSHLPFYVGSLHKGLCRLRKLCIDQQYVAGGDDEQQLAWSVGRVHRRCYPNPPGSETILTHEFPMRDEAARCGFRDYMHCLYLIPTHMILRCVLEIFQRYNLIHKMNDLLSMLDGALQRHPGSEISEVLELAMDTIPRIHLAQVWIP
ncbi:hypothetical protein SASPL_155582 [Salvia splendens]|uniref:Uncharacterized protein n=1 Tax=Salvia splendens TaxID=180675 RepID=A0A8X8YXD4_SALSN|nr:hypothetical protein SASPL_155582 [Salvia splendens]